MRRNGHSPSRNDRLRLPQPLPWSQTFYLCCRDVCTIALVNVSLLIPHLRLEDSFNNFMLLLRVYHSIIETSMTFFTRYDLHAVTSFTHLTSQSLDNFLANQVCETISQRLTQTSTLSQIAQIVTNLEHFQIACPELEHTLNNLRSAPPSADVDH